MFTCSQGGDAEQHTCKSGIVAAAEANAATCLMLAQMSGGLCGGQSKLGVDHQKLLNEVLNQWGKSLLAVCFRRFKHIPAGPACRNGSDTNTGHKRRDTCP